jgi:protocatechuate 3,4-dioxygenase beta subunit
VVLYCWHTNGEGIYPHRLSDPPNRHAYDHGYRRGWLRTGGDGRYVIDPIRPGSYPGGGNPAHIHCVAKQPGRVRSPFVDEMRFAGDPELENSQSRITLRGTSGGWEAEHSIVVPP